MKQMDMKAFRTQVETYSADLSRWPQDLIRPAVDFMRQNRDAEAFFRSIDEGAERLDLPELDIVRFRPPLIEETGGGITLSVPHIRLDRAMQFLFGDRLA